MKILIANSNTDAALTTRMVALARNVVRPSTELIGASAAFGAAAIQSEAEIETAAAATATLFDAAPADVDAAVVACFADPGLRSVQASTSFPVVGMAEAGLLAALAVAEKVAVVTAGRDSLPHLRRLVDAYGFAARVTELRALPVDLSTLAGGASALRAELQQTVDAASRNAGAVVVGGAFLAGMTGSLHAAVPLFNSLLAAVLQAEAAALAVAGQTTGKTQ